MSAKRLANYFLDSEASAKKKKSKNIFDDDSESDEMDHEEEAQTRTNPSSTSPGNKGTRKIKPLMIDAESEDTCSAPLQQRQPEEIFEASNDDFAGDEVQEEMIEPPKSVTEVLNLGAEPVEELKDLTILKLSDRAAVHVSKRLVKVRYKSFKRYLEF